MTKKELKTQVSEAGKHFIDEMIKKMHYKKWFDTQTFINDKKVERILYMIDCYNKEFDKWSISNFANETHREFCFSYYCLLEGMLNILKDIAFYDSSKYGSLVPFKNYCWSCCYECQPINFAEYERIRAFFESREEVSQ